MLLFLFCGSVMPRFTRRSKANDAADHTQGSSFDPLLSLQPASELTATKPSPEIHSANDLLGESYDLLVRHF